MAAAARKLGVRGMPALFGSLFGLLGTAQLHTVILVGMLAVTIFRPGRIGSWTAFRLSVALFVLAVALPGLAMLFPGATKGGDSGEMWLIQLILAGSGLLTALSVYFLLSCLSTAGPQPGASSDL